MPPGGTGKPRPRKPPTDLAGWLGRPGPAGSEGREGKGREGKGREGKGREGKRKEGKERKGKGREGKGLLDPPLGFHWSVGLVR